MIDIDVNPQLGVLTLVLDGPVAAADLRTLSERADARVRRASNVAGLLIKAPRMPAWRELSALLEHLRCMQPLRPKIRRIAVMTESAAASYAGQLQRFFPQAELARFSARNPGSAQAWLRAAVGVSPGNPQATPPSAPPSTSADEDDFVSLDEDQTQAGEEDAWFN